MVETKIIKGVVKGSLSDAELIIDESIIAKPIEVIERSIVKSYRKYLWVKFIKAIKEYQLIQPGDKVAVAISGGKDSLLLAKLFQELHKYSTFEFDVEYIAMDPGYNDDVRNHLESMLEHLEIPTTIYKSDVFEVAEFLDGVKPCYMCARMRRGALYAKAQELGCNKLALGHHYDDVIETILLNVLCSGNYKTMMPKLKAENFENMELIRPLYLIEEESIIRFSQNAGIQPLNCACRIAEKHEGKRSEIKDLIKNLEGDFTNVRESIFRSAENVDLGAIIGYKKNGEKINFLDNY
ncbi:MAG: tRNA 2-thiocytidine biosynthesis protein TtcA [Tissierellia bacterium]|nr:tRNA 2-thiocytidine biosynthesis protein TtcA [Tissierellia bacterium]